LAARAPTDRNGRIGGVSFAVHERTLTVTPERWPLRIAAFSGAGFGLPLRAAELTRIQQSHADVVLLVGGLGDDDANAVENAKALSSSGRLVITLLGGRDRMAIARAAFEAAGEHAGIIDATALRRVSVANNTLVTVAGAEQGRYAVDADACGFSPNDLAALAKELGGPSANERRWLLSWQAPAARPGLPSLVRTDQGLELGSRQLGQFAEQIGALGAISAWPVGRSDPQAKGPLASLSVPRLFGPREEYPDGSRREPGLSVIEADRDGLRLVGGR
jgi:hypothetical protein